MLQKVKRSGLKVIKITSGLVFFSYCVLQYSHMSEKLKGYRLEPSRILNGMLLISKTMLFE